MFRAMSGGPRPEPTTGPGVAVVPKAKSAVNGPDLLAPKARKRYHPDEKTRLGGRDPLPG